MAEKAKTLEKITKELFSLLKTKVGLEIKEEEDGVVIQLTTDEPGILIGYHGQALQAVQLLLA